MTHWFAFRDICTRSCCAEALEAPTATSPATTTAEESERYQFIDAAPGVEGDDLRNRGRVDRLAGAADAAAAPWRGVGGGEGHYARGGLRSVEIMAASTPWRSVRRCSVGLSCWSGRGVGAPVLPRGARRGGPPML